MQLPTINSQNCFRVACLVIYLFLHTCVGDREEKHQPHRMLSACHTQGQPGGAPSWPQVLQPSSRARTPSLHCREGMAFGMGGVLGRVGCAPLPGAVSRAVGIPLEHQKGSGRAPPGWSHRGDTAELIQRGHITQIPLEDRAWTLIPHRKWENKCPYSKGFFFAVNFSLWGWSWHLLLPQGRQLLSLGPIFPCLE